MAMTLGNAPTVSVLVTAPRPGERLDACLSSIRELTYPKERLDVGLVERGPAGDSASCNAAIEKSRSDFVALLSGGARVDPQWLTELVAGAQRHDAAAVASVILDRAGGPADFVGGAVSFTGHARPVRAERPPAWPDLDGKRLLFPSAASALFNRASFLDAGGFDEDFFTGLEEVDLGWRLNLFGYSVVLAPTAVTYRDASVAPVGWTSVRYTRLLERNALSMIYKNYDVDALARVLPVAVALTLLRALSRSGIDALDLSLSSRPPALFDVKQELVPRFIALEDFCRRLPALARKRQLVQDRRRRSDSELFELFVEPLRLPDAGDADEAIARTLIRDFGIGELFVPGHPPSSRRPPIASAELAPSSHRPSRPPPPIEPRVSIVILTALGPLHLRECLASLREQTYPPDRIEVIVVDNGSAEDPTEAVQGSFLGARVIRNPTNAGFAAGNNQGAAVATGDCVVFLNDDTRAHRDWLRELVATWRRREAAAVASCILDWPGERVDFVEGAVNFQGKGFQLHYGAPTGSLTLEEKPLLFACGGAMLIDRAVLSDVGGWDEGAFAYYEDVELGWRLRALGYDVWFAPNAIVYHKHHGTSGRWAEPPRVKLYERNSLRLIYELLETESLRRVLPAALLLAADRAWLYTDLSRMDDPAVRRTLRGIVASVKALLRARGVDRTTPVGRALGRVAARGVLQTCRLVVDAALGKTGQHRAAYLAEEPDPGSVDAPVETLSIDAVAVLAGIYGFLLDLPALSARRADVQRRRRAGDREVLGRFASHWLAPVAARFQVEHEVVQAVLVADRQLAEVIAPGVSGSSGRAALAGNQVV
jgi:GT2 family glycosyltransferase